MYLLTHTQHTHHKYTPHMYLLPAFQDALVSLFCVLVGLFCVLVGLFCVLVGLFRVYLLTALQDAHLIEYSRIEFASKRHNKK